MAWDVSRVGSRLAERRAFERNRELMYVETLDPPFTAYLLAKPRAAPDAISLGRNATPKSPLSLQPVAALQAVQSFQY